MFSRTSTLPLIFGLLCIGGLAAIRIADPFFLSTVRETAFDQFQQLSPREYSETPVRVVDIDEASLRQFGQWPWPRSLIAELSLRLGEMGAAAIAFDILFAEPDRLSPTQLIKDPSFAHLPDEQRQTWLSADLPDNDKLFGEAIAGLPVVFGFARLDQADGSFPPIKAGFAYTGEDPAMVLPFFTSATHNLPDLEAVASGIGSISLSPTESVSVVRKVPLLWSDGAKIYPSLAIEALRVAQGASTIVVHALAGEPTIVQEVRVGDLAIPTTPEGELWMRYSRERKDRYVSAAAILADEIEQETVDKINGHIVLIGTSAVGLYDIRATSIGENVPGVSIHAQLLEQIITSKFVYRGDWTDGLELFGFVVLSLFVLVMALTTGPVVSFISGGVVAAAIAAGTWLAYTNYGFLTDPTFPMAGGFMVYIAMTTFRYFTADRQKRQIRRAFSQYVAPAVLQQIEEHPESLVLGGETREVTVMFVDIRNFTSLSETLPPGDVILFLNALLSELSREITAEKGTIDKYIGDSIMAFWNAPVAIRDHAGGAGRAALGMRRALERFNDLSADGMQPEWRKRLPKIAIGTGITTGQACVGNMGSESRFDYSVVGDTVNVASRVETATKHLAFDIVLSGATAMQIPKMAMLEAGTIALKGKQEHIPAYILVGDEALAGGDEFRHLADAHVALLHSLREGQICWEELLLRCKALAAVFSCGLEAFYDRIPARIDDFRDTGGSIPPAGRAQYNVASN